MKIFNSKFLKIFLVFLIAKPCLATKLSYKIDSFELQFEKPFGYQVLRGYLGRDIVLLGPEKTKKRNTIFLEVTDSNRINFDEEKSQEISFKKIKTEWIKEKKAILNKFQLDQKLDFLKNQYLYHEVFYSLNGTRFVEGELFYSCSKKTASNISFLVQEERLEAFKNIFKRFLKSFECR